MGKGAAKFGFKSGTLPVVRHVLKKPTKAIVRPANPNVGYAEGVLHPRGTSREQPLPQVKTVEQLIKDTVKAPKDFPNLKELSETQKARAKRAALRREYYIDSLRTEEAQLEAKEIENKKREEAAEMRNKEQVHEISEATRLTLPTISKLLEGPLMRQRTEEEEEILHAKRRANRLTNQLTGDVNRATNLLELYYESGSFAVDEAGLQQMVDQAFSKTDVKKFFNPDSRVRSHKADFEDALFGKIHSKPGLVEVEEQLTGDRFKFEERLAKAKDDFVENSIGQLRESK